MEKNNPTFDFGMFYKMKSDIEKLLVELNELKKSQNALSLKWRPESDFYDLISKSKFFELRTNGEIKFSKPNGKTPFICMESFEKYLEKIAENKK